MWRAIYSLILTLAMPFVFARLAWRGIRNRSYWDHWGHRLGALGFDRGQQEWIWVHAVSVGEAQAAAPLVRALQDEYPEKSLLVTTTTPTGRERVVQTLGDSVAWQYAPYDTPLTVARFLNSLKPRALVVMETELWPNTIAACASRSIPVVLANARLSARSASRYRYIGALIATTLEKLTAVGAQSKADRERLIALGASPSALVTGNIKFDLRLPASVQESGRALRRIWGQDRSVWIAASTHEGEEEQVLEAFTAVREQHPDCLLVLVPRHPERFARAAQLARKAGYRCVLRSESPEQCADVDVYLGNTMGELPVLYAGADVAFVGGSLVPVGGHNMLEPAALGLPAVYGPYLHNFEMIAGELARQGGGYVVTDTIRLGQQVAALLHDANLRHASGERGRQFVAANRGALSRSADLVLSAIGGSKPADVSRN